MTNLKTWLTHWLTHWMTRGDAIASKQACKPRSYVSSKPDMQKAADMAVYLYYFSKVVLILGPSTQPGTVGAMLAGLCAIRTVLLALCPLHSAGRKVLLSLRTSFRTLTLHQQMTSCSFSLNSIRHSNTCGASIWTKLNIIAFDCYSKHDEITNKTKF